LLDHPGRVDPAAGDGQPLDHLGMTDDPAKACDETQGKALIGARLACARLRGNECTIYVKPPRNEDDRRAIYILGHEALHCFVGHFHYAAN
jgi:hypothetical protein